MDLELTNEFLRMPLYLLKEIKHIEKFTGLGAEHVLTLRQNFTPQNMMYLIDSLKYAQAHPEHDVHALMPELPFSNEQIHVFLSRVLASILNPPTAS